MQDRLPEIIDPVVFAERRIELCGKIKLKAFTRLEDLILDAAGDVAVKLDFDKQGRHAFIEGSASVDLHMQCQNCLESVTVPVTALIQLGIITTLEQADRLPLGYEALLIEDEKVVLKDLIEDELLLAMPVFPKHQHNCIKFEDYSVDLFAEEKPVEETKPENPFAVLAKLKLSGEK